MYVIIIHWCYTLVQEQVDARSLKGDNSERKPQEGKTQSEPPEEFEEVKGDQLYHCPDELLLSLCNIVCYPSDNFTHSERPWFIDQDAIRLIKEKLKSMPCQNQGFVLDGFPETIPQASDLFASNVQVLNEQYYCCTLQL